MTLFQTILNEDLTATEELLRQGSNPNLVQFNGASAFHIAVGIDNLELSEDLTKLILQYDGDPNVRSTEGSTPVHTAAAFGHCENLRLLLLNGGDPFLVDQDGLDALANARESGCGLCCAIVRQHQQKLLEDLMKPAETRSLYTISPYVPCEDHPSHYFSSVTRQTTSDPFISPPHDQLTVGRTSTHCPIHHQKPSKWHMEEATNIGHLLDEWQLGGERGKGPESRVSQGESKQQTLGADKDLLESSNSTESFYTCSDNGSAPEAFPGGCDSLHGASVRGTVCGVAAQPDDDASNQQVLVAVENRRCAPPTDEVSSLGCAILENSDKEIGVTIGDESLTLSGSFQLPSDYYSSSSDDDDDESSHSSSHVAPPISELARLHLNVGGIHRDCARQELSVINESQFTEDLRDESRLMTEDETEFEIDVSGQSDRYAVWTRSHSVTDNCECRGGAARDLTADSGVMFCSPDEKTMLDNFCRSRVDVTPRHDTACGVDVTPRYDMSDNDNWSVLTPKSNRCNFTEGTDTQLTPKQSKNPSQQWPNDTHGTHQPSQYHNSPRPHNRGGLSHEHFRGAGDGSSAHSDAPSEHHRLEKRLFRGCTRKWAEPPGAYPPSDSSVISISSVDSRTSLNSTVQYIYTDDEDGYSLLATRFLPDPPSGDRVCPELNDIPGDILGLGDTELRSRLASLGDAPGPITPGTRRLYQSRLDRLLKDPTLANTQDAHQQEFLPELSRALTGQLDMSSMDGLEDLMSEPFADPCASRRWREGTLKTSFNYLLLDPRVSQNLPARHKTMDKVELFRTFVRAVFYIGKGKRSRPYAHFKEAIQHLSGATGTQCGAKVQQIVDIWEAGLGVISLHVFQNVIPAEAYTREACIIDAVGLERLTNVKGGEYYGPVTTWSRIQRRTLGVHLLHKAFRILLIEGERQIQPHHICVGQ